jgi:hypothetical protein
MSPKKQDIARALDAIEDQGILLVYPIDNQPQPPSLWSVFYPRSAMRWEWDGDADARVPKLWILREHLSRSGKAVYAKWYRGRATFFSLQVFSDLACVLGGPRTDKRSLGAEAHSILETLESDSPLSTKEIKIATDLRGKINERAYERAMKELWTRLLIVGYGEKDDGAFPSLLSGASQHLFEDAWNHAAQTHPDEAAQRLESKLGADSPFLSFAMKSMKTRGNRWKT